MSGGQLAQYRKLRKRTQVETARALGVSQTYLSLLEAGKRPLSERLQRRAARFFDLAPTEVPAQFVTGALPVRTDNELAADLADLGYPGFAHLRRKRQRRRNPADVLLSGLNAKKRDARIVEAFPWLMLAFPLMNWKDVVRVAKMYDLQNRLGYIIRVAREFADQHGNCNAERLMRFEAELEPSMLAREDTLCNESMTNAERQWLAMNRPANARRWNVLADLLPEHLDHYE